MSNQLLFDAQTFIPLPGLTELQQVSLLVISHLGESNAAAVANAINKDNASMYSVLLKLENKHKLLTSEAKPYAGMVQQRVFSLTDAGQRYLAARDIYFSEKN